MSPSPSPVLLTSDISIVHLPRLMSKYLCKLLLTIANILLKFP